MCREEIFIKIAGAVYEKTVGSCVSATDNETSVSLPGLVRGIACAARVGLNGEDSFFEAVFKESDV